MFSWRFFRLPSKAKQNVRSVPFLQFIDDFGIHRNMYRALKGFYIIPAGLCYKERRLLANIFTLTLGPHGASMDDIIMSFRSEFDKLSRGTWMSINGTKTLVTAFPLAFTGDMPQQAKNSGALAHNAIIGCRSCYCRKDQRADLKFDIINYGRYHYQTCTLRSQGNRILGKTERESFFTQHGLKDKPSALEELSPTLDLVLTRPYDVPHSEWKGLGVIMQEILSKALCKKGRDLYFKVYICQMLLLNMERL
ncbi:hypothetical protein BDV40DRAFT_310810 [Aspergillus tamarii]|uniref:Uncharacterized protein n=1 Tax=Aspergillus tamarii TaxID=41984 RepID=A0A5N6V1X2_ASPTM|nr:hypothetical protein BDV40DRAFT_310810 [Aspergillus tamarii]